MERIDSEQLDAWRAFLAAHARVMRTLEHELETERELPLSWYEVLHFLNRAPGGSLRMHELASAVVVSRSGVTRLVDRMAAAGLVDRAECAGDRRGRLAVITDAGRRALRDASPVHMRGVKEHFADRLSAAEAKTIKRVCDRIAEGLTQPSKV